MQLKAAFGTVDGHSDETLHYNLSSFSTNTQSWQCCQLCIHIYRQFSSLFAPNDVSKCKIRNQGVHEHYILRLKSLFD